MTGKYRTVDRIIARLHAFGDIILPFRCGDFWVQPIQALTRPDVQLFERNDIRGDIGGNVDVSHRE